MRNRETLGNQTYPDITAWRGVRNAERNNTVDFLSPAKQLKPDNGIAELNGQLSALWQQKNTGEISPKEYRRQQQELASKLHEAERSAGHKPIRINKPHR